MNTNYLVPTIAAILFSWSGSAQTVVPNGGFENWENVGAATEEPTNWNSNKTGGGLAPVGPQTCFREATDAHTGTYCLRLQNGSAFGTPVNGSATTGKIEAPTFSPADGYIHTLTADPNFNSAFTGRPDSLVGWYKFAQAGGDIGQIRAFLHDSYDFEEPDQGSSVTHKIADALFNVPNGSTGAWTRFSVPFNYASGAIGSAIPTHILLICVASNTQGSANTSTTFWVDDLEAIYCTATTSSITETACTSYTSPSGHVWTTSNTYQDTIANAASCDSIITIDLTINTVDVSITQAGATLTANEVGATYQWLNCPALTPITGATSQVYNATASGDYAVIVTTNGCTDTSACVTVVVTGIIENDFGSGLLFYPNPTDGDLSIDLGDVFGDVAITMTDVVGKVVRSRTYTESQRLYLHLDEPAGVYLLRIDAGDKQAVVRFVKE
ncbi:MAG: T9SS type A sorting domain-containing protein [Flavobacteriales bacterium]|nr:T9SS type A sorting domain-containing protein [Flavobacteriales bacterium]